MMLQVKSAFLFLIGAIIWQLGFMNGWIVATSCFIIFLCLGGYETMVKIYVILPRDLRFFWMIIKSVVEIKWKSSILGWTTVWQQFELTAKKYPHKTMMLYEKKSLSYKEVKEYADNIARLFSSLDFQKGDCVAILLENKPEIFMIWLGLNKIGVVSSLINFNLRHRPLRHSLDICQPRAIICDHELLSALQEAVPDRQSCPVYVMPQGTECEIPEGIKNLEQAMKKNTGNRIAQVNLLLQDPVLYIYTSGTTGLPKAATMNNMRIFLLMVLLKNISGFTDKDVIWSPLPMYHSGGGVIGIGLCIITGGTFAFRRKFSARNFWDDIRDSKATVFQYLGEICRYVYAQLPKPSDREHRIRFMLGNGLKPQIWNAFVKRFNIPKVAEFYGSTEGNAALFNLTNVEGSIGFLSLWMGRHYPIALFKVDEAGNLIRDSEGLCVQCKPHEVGMILNKIDENNPMDSFEGYLSKEETAKKIVNDVFKKGDKAFFSGDLMVMDKYGNVFFKDRIGDTFRWKGENVSTAEVEAAIVAIDSTLCANVYGVLIPGTDGRAGMAAIGKESDYIGQEVDINGLHKGMQEYFPKYARPIFLRIMQDFEQHTTGTFKLKKVDLQKQGFDVIKTEDPIYYLNPVSQKYERLTPEVCNAINQGELGY